MYGRDFRAPKVDIHQFSMVPRADIPRSSFRMQHQHKTTISASYLYPVYVNEVLPGDSFNVSMTAFCRLSTPLFPLMDNLVLESFFFFVPCRLVWAHWYKFMGQQDNISDSISFTIPQVVSPANGFAQFSIYDYMGLPCVGQTGAGNTISVNALPLRAYNLTYNEWFRDENLINSAPFGSTSGVGIGGSAVMDDGPDPQTNYALLIACRKHDYFTACLPWTQKGGVAVTLPLGTSATVKTSASDLFTGAQTGLRIQDSLGGNPTVNSGALLSGTAGNQPFIDLQSSSTLTGLGHKYYPSNLYADLSTATAATINSIRLAFQTQRLLERDARGGTRYAEIVRSHFGVVSPDMRLQRPEYLGGSKNPINVTPVPVTTATGIAGTNSVPTGSLAAAGTGVHRAGFRQSFTEHGYLLGIVCVRADQAYQQGIRKMWSRSTRYDFYFPVFAALGEQSVLNKEIFSDGSANDALTFGYQERWAEYRYFPSYTSGYFRSTNATPLDAWHLGIKYATLPALNATFISDNTGATLARNLAAAGAANNQQFLCDFFFDQKVARPMPLYSVPGLVDHF